MEQGPGPAATLHAAESDRVLGSNTASIAAHASGPTHVEVMGSAATAVRILRQPAASGSRGANVVATRTMSRNQPADRRSDRSFFEEHRARRAVKAAVRAAEGRPAAAPSSRYSSSSLTACWRWEWRSSDVGNAMDARLSASSEPDQELVGPAGVNNAVGGVSTEGGGCQDRGRGRGVEGEDVQVGGDRERGRGSGVQSARGCVSVREVKTPESSFAKIESKTASRRSVGLAGLDGRRVIGARTDDLGGEKDN